MLGRLSKILIVAMVFVMWICVNAHPITAFAATVTSKAKTSAPPTVMTTYGLFDPSYTYLNSGDSSITDNGNATATISATTTTKTTVQSLGATITLQRYDGTTWFDVGSPTTLSVNNDYYFSNSIMKGTISGYYYRAHVVHWASNNGLYEQADRYTGNILAK